MSAEKLSLVDPMGIVVAELNVTDEDQGWFFGEILTQHFSPQLTKALDWYDEVLATQTLSVLDEALAMVEQFGLKVRYPNGSLRKVFSLHVNKQNEVSFRTTPVPPPAWLSKSESA